MWPVMKILVTENHVRSCGRASPRRPSARTHQCLLAPSVCCRSCGREAPVMGSVAAEGPEHMADVHLIYNGVKEVWML